MHDADAPYTEQVGATFERRVLDALGNAVIATDTDGVITYMNAAAEDLYGYRAGEAIGKPGADLMVPSDAAEDGRSIRSRVAAGEMSSARIRLRKKDGSTFLARMQASPIHDETGGVAGLVGVTWDVTDEFQTEQDLFSEKEAIEALINAIPDLIFHLGRDGAYRFVHATQPDLLSLPVDELLGRRVEDVMQPEAADLWIRAIERAIDGRTTSRIEYTIKTVTGEERTFEGHLAPLYDNSVVAIARDITELKRVQRSLKAERDQFIEVALLAPIIMGIYCGPDHVCEFANQNLIDVLGGRQLMGLSVRESIPELSSEGLIELMDRVYETGEPITVKEKRLELHVDPDLPPVERFANLNYMPLMDETGRVRGVLSHHVDITEQVVARRGLQVRNDMIQAVVKADSTATIARVALDGFSKSIPSDLSAVVLFTEDSAEIIPLSVLRSGEKATSVLRGLSSRNHLPPGVDPDTPATVQFKNLADVEDGGPLIDALKEEGLQSLLIRTLSDGRDCTGMILFSASRPFRSEHEALCEELAESLAVALGSARMLEDIEQARARLEAVNLQLVTAQEDERHALALELHDHVGQVLTSVMFALHDFDEATLPEAVLRSLERSRSLVMELAAEVRSLSLDLRPPMLDDFGLKSTLEWYSKKVSGETGVEVQLSTAGISEGLLPELIRTTAFRVIQEALTNVARHADVKVASVKVLRREDRLFVRIQDRGKGFNVEKIHSRPVTGGLSGMLERVRLLDGELTVESDPGVGTTVIATIMIPS